MDPHSFLVALTIVLTVAAVTTVVFQWLRQPVVLGYVLAGFIIGPNVPIPLVADRQIVATLSELGVILLMFSLGLEFSLRKLVRLGPTASITAVVQSSLMIWAGFLCGQFFGWTTLESLFAGSIIAISSTTIIAKAFDEQQVERPLRELVVGVLIVEDLIAILLMTILTAVASGTGLSLEKMAVTTGALAAFLFAVMALGLLLVPRAVRAVNRLQRPETTVVASVGFCFAVSLLAYEFGYSVALGAFIAGSLIAESGEHHEVEHLVQPVRDIFAAIFFVSVGITIDPELIARHWQAVAALTLLVVVGKVVGVTLGALLTGSSVRTAVRAGMSLAQIGEFSFIIAGLGLSLRATGDFLYPIAVAVSALTTLTTPWLIKASGPVANLVDRKLPRPLQTFVALYGSWLERMRSAPRESGASHELRRLVRLLVLDVLVLAALAIGTSAGGAHLASLAAAQLGLPPLLSRYGVLGLAIAISVPFGAGIVRVARKLGFTIAQRAFPAVADGATDLATAPRRLLIVTLQLAVLLLTGLPLLALTQPLFGGVYAPAVFLVLLVFLGVAFWRKATDLEEHVRAGAQAVAEALLKQPQRRSGHGDEPEASAALAQIRKLLPGLGDPTAVVLTASSPAMGRSLAELNLRGVTGATVLAITRDGVGLLVPTASEVLRAGDTLALAGTHDAVLAAAALLHGGGGEGEPAGATATPPRTPNDDGTLPA